MRETGIYGTWVDEKCIQNFGRSPERRMPLGRSRCRWEQNIKWILRNYVWKVSLGFIWLMMGTGGGLL
jgi:hypothetical protein